MSSPAAGIEMLNTRLSNLATTASEDAGMTSATATEIEKTQFAIPSSVLRRQCTTQVIERNIGQAISVASPKLRAGGHLGNINDDLCLPRPS